MKLPILLTVLVTCSFFVSAQIPCRPLISLIDYSGHDDRVVNADMVNIQTIKPDILIDNTPHGYWGGYCLPVLYNSYGIHVYSYITGGYEGTKYHTSEDDSATNITRIDGIVTDSAYGVFLDEVSATPTTTGKGYIAAMYSECHAKGLKLMLNPGTYIFDTFLISHSDYILTDERYDGKRSPSSSELTVISKMIVVNDTVTSPTVAAAITDSARSYGYIHSYACYDYMVIPSWISPYMSLITYPTPTPIVTLSGGVFHSSAPYGNQWYNIASAVIPGANGQNFTPTAISSYYDIVTLSGCSSAPSDTVALITTGISSMPHSLPYHIYPNPSTDEIHIDNAMGTTITLHNLIGNLIFSIDVRSSDEILVIKNFPTGLYILEIHDNNDKTIYKIQKL